jgi:alpha-beta hydrolase superfamily lysophospholipase
LRRQLRCVVVGLAAVAALGVTACGAGSEDAESAEQPVTELAKAGLGPAGENAWKAYVDGVIANNPPLQAECKPVRIPATLSGPLTAPKGVVVLYHGYTACPQQFMNASTIGADGKPIQGGLASRLSKEGYEVLLPLLPGHGRVAASRPAGEVDAKKNLWPRIDDTRDVPGIVASGEQLANSGYTKLVETMNAVVAASTPVNKVVGGISVGAVLATHATLIATKPYTRALIAAPFYQAGDAQINLLRTAANAAVQGAEFVEKQEVVNALKGEISPLLLSKLAQTAIWKALGESPLGWGETCETIERNGGRAGICQFKVKHLAGVLEYGRLVQELIAKRAPQQTKFQITGVVSDPVVSNREVEKAALALPNSNFCIYDKANHSMFSWRDSATQNQDKKWIPPLEIATIKFLTSSGAGAEFKTNGAVQDPSVGKALPLCSINP